MSDIHAGSADAIAQTPNIRTIRRSDLIDALAEGTADFAAAPTHVVFVSLIYPVIGLVLFRATFHYNLIPLLFPIVAGFALLGPFAAIGLYEISRLRERGRAVTWRNALDVLQARSLLSILLLGGVLIALFLLWLSAAYTIYTAIFGEDLPLTAGAFIDQLLGTMAGLKLLVIGNLVGAAFAAAAFAVGVVSFPLLIDRHTDAMTAVRISLQAVAANPRVMAEWGLIVAAALAVGSIPLLLGLPVVMPILGHATWHLYRKLVA